MSSTLRPRFKNQCAFPIKVFDNHDTCKLPAISKGAPVYGCDREIPNKAIYRHDVHPQATLAEFSNYDGKAFYGISIIPPGSATCGGYETCRKFMQSVDSTSTCYY